MPQRLPGPPLNLPAAVSAPFCLTMGGSLSPPPALAFCIRWRPEDAGVQGTAPSLPWRGSQSSEGATEKRRGQTYKWQVTHSSNNRGHKNKHCCIRQVP